MNIDQAHATAVHWARALLKTEDWLILDTETTGLGPDAEPIQIAIISAAGDLLIDTLVKPTCPISAQATALHHIANADVEHALDFAVIYDELAATLRGRRVVIYNAQFDRSVLHNACFARGLRQLAYTSIDAMVPYARWVGEWNERFHDYKWQPLPNAGHSALSDCFAVLALIKQMAQDGVT